jgi:hypothetical protein
MGRVDEGKEVALPGFTDGRFGFDVAHHQHTGMRRVPITTPFLFGCTGCVTFLPPDLSVPRRQSYDDFREATRSNGTAASASFNPNGSFFM